GLARSLGAAETRALASAGIWTPVGPDGGVILSLAVDPSDDGVVYAGTNGGGVFRSDDGGASWRWRGNGLNDLSIEELTIDSSAAERVYAGSLHGGFRSNDGGASWSPLGAGSPGGIINSI